MDYSNSNGGPNGSNQGLGDDEFENSLAEYSSSGSGTYVTTNGTSSAHPIQSFHFG